MISTNTIAPQFAATLASLVATPEAVVIADENERILHFNPAAERMFGKTAAQTLGHSLDQLIAPQHARQRAKNKAANLLEMMRVKPISVIAHNTAGESFSLEASLKQFEASGHAVYALTMRELNTPLPRKLPIAESHVTSAERRAAIFDSTYEFLGLLRPDGSLLDANASALDFIAATLADVQGCPFWETPWWGPDEAERKQLQNGIAAAANGEFVRFETQHHGACGDVITVDFSLKPVKNEQGIVTLLVPEGRDITERKKYELALQRAYEKLQQKVQNRTDALKAEREKRIEYKDLAQEREQFNVAVLGSLSHHIAILDRAGTIISVNEAWRQFAAANGADNLDNMLGDNYLAICRRSAESGEMYAQQALVGIESVLEGKSQHFSLEYPCHSPLEQRWFLMEVTPLQLAQGGAVISHLNITERKCAESAARSEQARTASIVESAMDAIISVDEQHKIVLFNHAAERMFGYQANEMLGQPLARLLPASFQTKHVEHIRQFGQTGATARAMGALGAVSGLRQNGEEFPIEAAISQMETNGQKLYTVILRDISRRREAEARLQEQAALLNQAREAIVSSDLKGHIQFWNHGAEQVYGWTAEEVMGRELRDLLRRNQPPPLNAESEQAQAILVTGEWQGELRQITKAGQAITVDCHVSLVRDKNGQPSSFLIINNDVTQQKQLEAQFLRAQRMESIGTLAGGIAHDLNNILSPLSMGLQMMQMKYRDEYAQKMLEMMTTNVQRGAEMVKQILQFARGVSGERIAVQLKHLVKELLKLLAETFPKSISLRHQLGENPALVLGDATQLHQVLLNLCVNARDAMPDGGTLTIGLENLQLHATHPMLSPDAKPGAYVVLSVTDTGEGIAAENLPRIFDPFFTTKAAGKGTGLGLATVFGIVRAHEGFVTVESEIGTGTQFKVYLPALTAEAASPFAVNERVIPVGQGELILVADDEAAIREMSRAALESYGYRVLTAANGAEALTLFAQHQTTVKLVITDLQMPELDGLALLGLLYKLKPELGVICCTGSAELEQHEILAHFKLRGMLTKPLNVETLLNTVAQALKNTEPECHSMNDLQRAQEIKCL